MMDAADYVWDNRRIFYVMVCKNSYIFSVLDGDFGKHRKKKKSYFGVLSNYWKSDVVVFVTDIRTESEQLKNEKEKTGGRLG